ncbi:hypothetical protein [Biformimicrobium ophioploci]|uniref:Uncharacterized protein n=1 Tax=Biformimicrobium ophioploci TaxID=3036711 RepID=A0ABQ6LWP1_9GAMM|nr:hypothetical protein [Microbulbifer sp. NKW57]GMG86483.1 hypothetical protein MNKW57_08040 [Microbulbifer sp. NKW57]
MAFQVAQRLAQGQYHYWCDGRTMAVQEFWQLGNDDDGQRVISGQRMLAGEPQGLRVDARCGPEGVRECEFAWRDALGEVGAHYYQQDDGIVAKWHGPNGAQERFLSGGNLFLFPLLRIFMGPLVRLLAGRDTGADLVIPCIVDPSARGKLLEPEISHRRPGRPMPDNHRIPDFDVAWPVSAYLYCGDSADAETCCYIAGDDLLLGYDFTSTTGRRWNVRLENLEWSTAQPSLFA